MQPRKPPYKPAPKGTPLYTTATTPEYTHYAPQKPDAEIVGVAAPAKPTDAAPSVVPEPLWGPASRTKK